MWLSLSTKKHALKMIDIFLSHIFIINYYRYGQAWPIVTGMTKYGITFETLLMWNQPENYSDSCFFTNTKSRILFSDAYNAVEGGGGGYL